MESYLNLSIMYSNIPYRCTSHRVGRTGIIPMFYLKMQACKPDFVSRDKRDSYHLSGTVVTDCLKRPTHPTIQKELNEQLFITLRQ